MDPYHAPVTEVADFLTDLAKMPHKGKPMAHSTIVGYRTAIASIHSGFEGEVSVSSHPVLSALLKDARTSFIFDCWRRPIVAHITAVRHE